jgi:hypothetical protein
MSKIKDSIYNVLRGKFLISDDSIKNWGFISYIVLLMLFMVASSHNSDRKVMEIAQLNKEVRELRAKFLDMRSISMKMKLESAIRVRVSELGLKPSENPPQVIKVIPKKPF